MPSAIMTISENTTYYLTANIPAAEKRNFDFAATARFFCVGFVISAQDLLKVEFRIIGNPILLTLFNSSAQLPIVFPFPVPILIEKNAAVRFAVTNLSGSLLPVYTTIFGYGK